VSRPRFAPVVFIWSLLAIVAVEIVVTYWRVPPAGLYHVSGTGPAGGFGRALVYLNFPVALATLPLAVLAADRLRARRLAVLAGIVAVALCSVVFWPGVVEESDLDPRAINALPAAGVALALALTALSGLFRVRVRANWALAAFAALLLVLALPWIAADLGFYLDGVPVLDHFLTGKPYEGTAAVHHGHHHGMDGVLLALTALAAVPLVRRARLRAVQVATAAYVGLQLVYGLANVVNDAWLEQVVKRGWLKTAVPGVLTPSASFAWLGIVVGAAVAAVVVLGSTHNPR
jgi:hypothetical protein